MKEHTATVDSTSGDEIVTERGKIEDMEVDVVSGDDSGVSKSDLGGKAGANGAIEEGSERETVSRDQVMEDVAEVKKGSADLVESRVEVVVSEEGVKESVEVVKEVIQENVVTKTASEPLSKEADGIEVSESVRVVEEKTKKEGEVLNSSKISESTEAVDEGLVRKDKVEDEDNSHVSAKNIENQDGVEQTDKESSQSTVEATTNDAKKCGNDDSKVVVESVSVKEEDTVINEETVKDEALDSAKISESVTVVDEVVLHENAENLDKKGEVDKMSKEDSLQPKIEVRTDDALKSEDSKMDDVPQDEKEDPESGLTKETVEQPTGSVQEMADGDQVKDEKTVKDDVLNPSKISQSVTMASLGLEDVDVVIVDEGLEGKNEAQDGVSVELSLVCPGNQSLPTEVVVKNAGIGEVEQKVEVDSTSKVVTDVTNSSKHDVVAHTEPEAEPESSIEKMTPGTANKVEETDMVDQTSNVEPAAIGGNSSNIEEDQGLIANHANEGNEITASHNGAPDSTGVLPANLEGEDAGMDIDEVLGWKDETQSAQEDEQKVDPIKKRKATDSVSDGSVEAKPSLKVGAAIQKVACQPSGPSIKGETDEHIATASLQSPGPTHTGKQAEMLSQLSLTAQDPMKGYSFMNTIIPFFKSHRAAVLSNSRKRKTSNDNQPDEFEFDDVNDSYWTDRVIQNHPEEQENPNGGGEHQIVAYEQEKPPVKPTRRSNKKRFFSSNHEIEAKEQSEVIVRRQQNLATEVLMKFADGLYFPSEIHLNKMFRRFGPLLESETEVDRQSGRARVVFKKCSDAEVAHSSAGTFNIFGSISVNYELNYAPVISYKPLPLPLTQDPPHAC